MCPERAYDLEGLGKDTDMAIVAADKDIVGSRTDAVEVVALATSALGQTMLVGGSTDIEG